MKGLTHEQSRELRESILAYRKDGHYLTETAEHFGVSKQYVGVACAGHKWPAEPQKGKAKNQYTSASFDRIANAKRYIEERTPWFEYAGNYTGIDGYVDLKCKKCGAVIRKSFVSVKHGTSTCQNCKAIEREKQEQEKRKKADSKRKEKHDELVKRETQKAKERAELIKRKTHPCFVCGRLTTNRYCCSVACSEKRSNNIKEIRRREKLKEAIVDTDITLEKVYRLNDGICYLCGSACDWNDKEIRENGIVCGNTYPSIDHVIPLANGGKHEWGNVRLAHRRCNSIKADKDIPLV